ncbi:MAG: hypothetical protein QGG74_01295 [Phycisphaerales bacterium]|jgi:hypothetical protein|nr:hypothetical protein [Phycisphaerales bacterium]
MQWHSDATLETRGPLATLSLQRDHIAVELSATVHTEMPNVIADDVLASMRRRMADVFLS